MKKFSHLDKKGNAKMVDVGSKKTTLREAIAKATVVLPKEVFKALKDKKVPKGNVFSVAKISGILAAKKTPQLIPLCHTILLDKIDISFSLDEEKRELNITSYVKARERTGVEMEALTAVTVCALCVYDMCKGIDKGIVIKEIYLQKKTGGKSGEYQRKEVKK
jgi:cyclic pyranopterin phosphate synthase